MGKVRGLRARVHQAAVRPVGEAARRPASPSREATSPQASAGAAGGKEWAFVSTDVFARTKIDPSALVQKLDLDTRSVTSIRRGTEAKTILPKKEKLKLRRERWLQKIEAIKLAEQKRKAERRRRATVVVGDLQPLRDALPELPEPQAGGQQPHTRGASSRPRPAEWSRMSAAQRLQLLEEERTRFQELLASPAYRASPLLAIGQQLAQQMRQDCQL
ncbi:ribosome biogenesis protein SLX9 homolog isoform X1 [Manis pentadactyla]|uniref:ribosome biogenesis protein SLX9 homolog isoform X1 n=1 Tax=Manis pentadactyla TaxID=143292 RepID=UPI0018775029|nr:ribosome biogenesis protein SLX9 homolog isoform X1 [Manis pentadactyla]